MGDVVTEVHREVCSAKEISKRGREWLVVGGGAAGGIIARRAESMKSPEFPVRLATGARIEEISLVNNRLHYKKLSGDGPDFGWVSLTYNGTNLVEPKDSGQYH